VEPFGESNQATLPCLHPMCTSCLSKKESGECLWFQMGIYCHSKWTQGDVLLPTSFAPQVVCGSCEESPATHECTVCQIKLCTEEASAHSRAKATKAHTLVPLFSALEATQNACETHRTVPATLYCTQCDKRACVDCLKSHEGHAFESIGKGLMTRSELIKANLTAVQKKWDDFMLGGDDEVKQDLDFLTAHLATTTAKIDEAFDAILLPARDFVVSVENRKHELRKNAQEAIMADLKTLEEQVDTLATFKHDVDVVKAVSASSTGSATQQLVSARLAALDKLLINSSSAVRETTHFSTTQPIAVAKVLESIMALKAVQVGELGELSTRALRL